MNKYGDAARDANYEFVPLVIDVSGKLHPAFHKFLTDVLKLASEIFRFPSYGIIGFLPS
jgi:hypothetical protein